MNNRKLIISLVTTMLVTGACSKNHDKNTDEKIQSIVDQTNASNHEQVKKVKADFDKMKNEMDDVTKEAERQSSEALDRVPKSTLNFVNKMVRVDLLNENDLIERSYLDFFELDPTAGVFKSKFENLFFAQSAGICLNLASLDCETTFDYVTLNLKWGTVGSGRFALTEEFKEQGARLPGTAFKSFSKVSKLEKDYLILDLSRPQMSEKFRFDDQLPPRKIKISLLGGSRRKNTILCS